MAQITKFFPVPVGGMNTKDPVFALQTNESPLIKNFNIEPGGYATRRYGMTTPVNIDGNDPAGSTHGYVLAAIDRATDYLLFVYYNGSVTDRYEILRLSATNFSYNTIASYDSNFFGTFNVTNFNAYNFIYGTAGVFTGAKNGVRISPVNAVLVDPFTGYTGNVTRGGTYRGRFYLANNTGSIFYGGAGNIGGAVTEYPMTSLLNEPTSDLENVIFLGAIDGNIGSTNSIFGYISSRGTFLGFQGEYPGSTTWNLIKKIQLPKPIIGTSVIEADGEYFYIGEGGVFSLTSILNSNETNVSIQDANIGKNIANLLIASNVGIYASLTNPVYSKRKLYLPMLYSNNMSQTSTLLGKITLVYSFETRAWCIHDFESSNLHQYFNHYYTRYIHDGSYDADVASFHVGIQTPPVIRATKLYYRNSPYDYDTKEIPYFIQHNFDGFNTDSLKTAVSMRPIVSSITNAASLGVSADFEPNDSDVIAHVGIDASSGLIGNRNTLASKSGYFLAPKISASEHGDIKYLGTFLTVEKGSKL